MQRKLTCKQIQAILPFYIKGRVNPAMTEIIEEHLGNCPKCKEFYLKAFNEYNDIVFIDNEPEIREESDERFVTKEYANFKKMLSAYVDSELDNRDNIKIRKMTISNPLARKDLENMYLFKRLLHSSFERTKENCRYDFAKPIVKKLDEASFYQTDYFIKIGMVLIFISVMLSITIFSAH